MSRTINDFPTELVRLVLAQVQVNSYDDDNVNFPRTLTVCKAWNEIGEELLYNDIALTGSQLVKFDQAHRACLNLTRTLTIQMTCLGLMKNELKWRDAQGQGGLHTTRSQIPGDAFDDSETAEGVYTAFAALPGHFPSMSRLESFSLTVSSQRVISWTECGFDITPVLRALPASLANLELDIQYHPADSVNAGPCLCKDIRAKLGGLTTVRLKLPHVCAELFFTANVEQVFRQPQEANNSKTGKTIIINTIDARYNLSNSQMLMLVKHAEVALAAGLLGPVKHLSVLSICARREENHSGDKIYSAVNVQSFVPEPKTKMFPFKKLTSIGIQDADIPIREQSYMRYLDSDGKQQVACGAHDGIVELAEGEVWACTTGGHRLPRSYLEQKARFEDSPLLKSNLMSAAQITAKIGGMLIAREEHEGAPLLLALEKPGVDKVGGILRKRSRAERIDAGEVEAGPDHVSFEEAISGAGDIDIELYFEHDFDLPEDELSDYSDSSEISDYLGFR